MGPHELSVAERLRILEELATDEAIAARKRSAAAFSDEQRRQMDENLGRALVAFVASDAFDKAVNLVFRRTATEQAVRFIGWLIGAFILGAVSAYFKLKGW